MSRSIAGHVSAALVQALGAVRRREVVDRDTLRCAVTEMAARGIRASDIGRACGLDERTVRSLLELAP